MLTGRAEFTQLPGLMSGLSCNTQPSAAAGHVKDSEPPAGAKFSAGISANPAVSERLPVIVNV
jgi:hypothetical protein